MVYLLRNRPEAAAKLEALSKAWNLPKADILALAVEVLWDAREEDLIKWDWKKRVIATRPETKKEKLVRLMERRKRRPR